MDWSLVTEFISLQNHVLQIFFLRVEIKVRIKNRPSLSQIVICLPLWSCIWAFRGSYHYIRDTRKCSPKTLPLKSCSDLKKIGFFLCPRLKLLFLKMLLFGLEPIALISRILQLYICHLNFFFLQSEAIVCKNLIDQ